MDLIIGVASAVLMGVFILGAVQSVWMDGRTECTACGRQVRMTVVSSRDLEEQWHEIAGDVLRWQVTVVMEQVHACPKCATSDTVLRTRARHHEFR